MLFVMSARDGWVLWLWLFCVYISFPPFVELFLFGCNPTGIICRICVWVYKYMHKRCARYYVGSPTDSLVCFSIASLL